MENDKELWTCPECGNQFVTANIWHSCGNYDFEHHFTGKNPILKIIFDKFRSIIEECGHVTCTSQKTRIVFMVRMRFAGCVIRKNYVQCHLLLPKRYEAASNLIKIEKYGEKCLAHYFKIETPEDLDHEIRELIQIAYQVGEQRFIQTKK